MSQAATPPITNRHHPVIRADVYYRQTLDMNGGLDGYQWEPRLRVDRVRWQRGTNPGNVGCR